MIVNASAVGGGRNTGPANVHDARVCASWVDLLSDVQLWPAVSVVFLPVSGAEPPAAVRAAFRVSGRHPRAVHLSRSIVQRCALEAIGLFEPYQRTVHRSREMCEMLEDPRVLSRFP